MGNEIEVFQNPDFGEIRTLAINGEPWFLGVDIAQKLGYTNLSGAISDHVDREDRQVLQKSENATFEIPNRGLTIINESGLYSLILSSKLPTAKSFKRWITSEVIPAIRKTGAYRSDNENLFRCAQIMAGCRPENLYQVMNILGQIVPGIGAENPACEVPALPQTVQLSPSRKYTHCEEKFNTKALDVLCTEKGISNADLTKMLGCSECLVSKWLRGICQPSVEYRERLCVVLGTPPGFFNLRRRRKRK